LLGEAYPQFDVVWFGHIGDGNLHINVLKPDGMEQADFVADCERVTKLLAERCTRMAAASPPSTASAWSRSPICRARAAPAEIALMRGIKAGAGSGRDHESGQVVRLISGRQDAR
jgi:FAD/FMN-containing dehydrogenase